MDVPRPAPADRVPAAARAGLALLTLVYVVNFLDRQLVSIVAQPMKLELGLTDRQYGLLGGTAFAAVYTLLGLPAARLAERRSRAGVVAAALALWSAMTALCGVAPSYGWLLAARVGVGIGEAGCAAPSQSLVADLVPPRARATALGLLSLGVPLGMLLAGLAGGALAQALGWRLAFVALGLPGVALAAVVRASLREPARGAFDTDLPAAAPPPIAAVARGLWASRAFRHMAAGAALASFAGYGLTSFAAAYAARAFGVGVAAAGGGFGLVAGLGIGVGIAGGGWASDRLAARTPAAPGLVAGAGVILAAALFEWALTRPSPLGLALAALAPFALAHLYFGPTYAVTLGNAGPASRATAVALLLVGMNGIGLGLGPLAVGWLSDRLADPCAGAAGSPACLAASAAGLRRALAIDLAVYPWAGVHFLLAGRALARRG